MRALTRSEFADILAAVRSGRAAELMLEAEGVQYIRRFIPEDRLILLGGGHIAVPLCAIASMIGFAVTVVDDRPDFANHERFPGAAEVICDSFANAVRRLQVRGTDYICVITRGHRWDGECMRQILQGEYPAYLGMIGSLRRAAGLMQILKSEGYDPEKLDAIHTPIGLAIGAETTAEIAVSICAELISVKRSIPSSSGPEVLKRMDSSSELLRFIAEGDTPAALMTVIAKQGSTPVESGAVMVTDRFGRTAGTIGGGCGEAEALKDARNLIGSGRKSRVIEVDMSNAVAEEEGMVCGGRMRVLITEIENKID